MKPATPIGTPQRPDSAPRRFALWQLGFRPFYLLASIFAAGSIALWAAQYAGVLKLGYLPGPLWHVHEMLFGFTLAVIAGFLFTAVRNWTNQPTPTGGWLMAIAALWVAGRILVLTPSAWLSAAVNAAFPLAVAVGIGVPLVRARNTRNYFFIALLVLMAGAILYVHTTSIVGRYAQGWIGIRVALDVVLLIVAIMTGRVVPMFTNNAIAGANARRHPLVERTALGSVVLLAILDGAQIGGTALVVILVVAAAVHTVRWLLWNPHRTLRVPLVWVLHAAYAWIPLHLVLRAASEFHLVTSSLAAHALTTGAIGGMIIGMITRTARGHTGRPLKADTWDTTCYALVLLAAILRVFGPLLVPAWYMSWITASAVAWSAAFGLYAITYWSPLTRARPDGKPG